MTRRYKQKQSVIFRQQLEIAAESGLNCIIHERSAFEDTLAHMQKFTGRVRGVFHCFVGDPAAMRRVLDLGSLVSFTGIATFKNAQTVRETIAAVPLDRFMLETDSPYLAPVPYRGKRCEPGYVKEISELVAQTRGCTLDQLSTATCATAGGVFSQTGLTPLIVRSALNATPTMDLWSAAAERSGDSAFGGPNRF